MVKKVTCLGIVRQAVEVEDLVVVAEVCASILCSEHNTRLVKTVAGLPVSNQ